MTSKCANRKQYAASLTELTSTKL